MTAFLLLLVVLGAAGVLVVRRFWADLDELRALRQKAVRAEQRAVRAETLLAQSRLLRAAEADRHAEQLRDLVSLLPTDTAEDPLVTSDRSN